MRKIPKTIFAAVIIGILVVAEKSPISLINGIGILVFSYYAERLISIIDKK